MKNFEQCIIKMNPNHLRPTARNVFRVNNHSLRFTATQSTVFKRLCLPRWDDCLKESRMGESVLLLRYNFCFVFYFLFLWAIVWEFSNPNDE